MKNFHAVVNARGQIVSRGEGPPIALKKGWVVNWYDTAQERDASPEASKRIKYRQAVGDLIDIGKIDRTQAFATKYREAVAFLDSADQSISSDNQNVIDETLYPALYDEYWSTYDQVDWPPFELATRIIARAERVETEGDLRRRKLIAEKLAKEYK